MIWVVLLILLLMSCFVYLFLGWLKSAFPDVFNKPKNKVANSFSDNNSDHSEYEPQSAGVLFHNLGSYSKQDDKSDNNDRHKYNSEISLTHNASKKGVLIERIIPKKGAIKNRDNMNRDKA